MGLKFKTFVNGKFIADKDIKKTTVASKKLDTIINFLNDRLKKGNAQVQNEQKEQ